MHAYFIPDMLQVKEVSDHASVLIRDANFSLSTILLWYCYMFPLCGIFIIFLFYDDITESSA